MSDKSAKEWFADWFDSPYYHVLYGHRSDEEADRFVAKLLQVIQTWQPKKGLKVLDLACGAGRHSRALNDRDCIVTGIDLSPESIELAESVGPDSIDYRVADMRRFEIKNQFDLVLNCFTSFGYFSKVDDNRKVLQRVVEHLSPGGIFVLDFLNAERVINHLVPEEQLVKDGITFLIRRRMEEECIVKDIHFEAEGEQFDFQERVQALTLSELSQLLNEAGLSEISSYGSYDFEPYEPHQSKRLILISRKHE